MSKTVVLVVLDSLRFDVFYEYLQAEEQSFLDQMRESSLDFTGATATAPWSLPSHASIFTGKYPREHGALRFNTRIRGDLPTLVDQLNDRGFVTACFTSNAFVQSAYGFGDWHHAPDQYGYARFRDAHSPLSDESGVGKVVDALGQVMKSGTPLKSLLNAFYGQARRSPALVDDGGKLMTRDATRWLQDVPDEEDVFMFCNYMETHVFHKRLSSLRRRAWNVYNAGRLNELQSKLRETDLDPSERLLTDDDVQLLKTIMTDELRYLDSLLEKLYEEIKSQGRVNDCLFIVCSDHGEALDERGFVYHDFGGLTEPLVRVPLLISNPDGDQDTIQERVSLSWLYSTVLNYVEERETIDLADPDTYPAYVAAENSGHVLDIIDSPDVVHDYYLDDRVAVYRTNDPTRKYVRVGDVCTVRRIETDGLDEVDVESGGEDVVALFENEHDSVTEKKFDLSDTTESRLRDLGYI